MARVVVPKATFALPRTLPCGSALAEQPRRRPGVYGSVALARPSESERTVRATPEPPRQPEPAVQVMLRSRDERLDLMQRMHATLDRIASIASTGTLRQLEGTLSLYARRADGRGFHPIKRASSRSPASRRRPERRS